MKSPTKPITDIPMRDVETTEAATRATSPSPRSRTPDVFDDETTADHDMGLNDHLLPIKTAARWPTMEDLEKSMQRAAKMLANFSIHANYTPSVIESANTISDKLTQITDIDKSPRKTPQTQQNSQNANQPRQPGNEFMEQIANSLTLLTSRLDTIEVKIASPQGTATRTQTPVTGTPTSEKPSNTSPVTEAGPRTVHATSKPIVPKPKGTMNNNTKVGSKGIPTNPLAAHHPSRLIVEIQKGAPGGERPKEIDLVRQINDVLQSSEDSKHLRVVNVKFNPQQNCIVFTRADQSAAELAPFADRFTEYIAQDRPTRVRPDVPWYKVQLNGVNTFNDYTNDIPTPEELHEELCLNNPTYATMPILQLPRWMHHPSDLKTQFFSSVVIALMNEADAEHLVKHVKNLAIAGRFAEVKRYADKPPIIQCNNCWSLDHTRWRCHKKPICRLCAGDHLEARHVCDQCPMQDEEEDAMNTEGEL
ncbi:hypothetical protein SCP_1201700 [Sparassis crispa]|uniref:Uncharacterized protein n=1 Tax=Sparassis crispa TaxID=139825 RepID=A0A401H0J8_9APHY|nr:hypothetical protein SCP_1201700 [Sparassis crispa]GBE87944.1 hypothetical protein SCP_1201700 [Sparassis crispa]